MHRVVIDPGVFTAVDAVDGATVVLVTHEHPDHWTPDTLRATHAPIFTIAAVAEQIRANAPAAAERVTVVAPADRFVVGGVSVTAVGEKHAVIHPELPHFDNSGFVLEAGGTSLFHPGDSFELPGRPVDVHCAPVSAPWAKMSELVDTVQLLTSELATNAVLHARTAFAVVVSLTAGVLRVDVLDGSAVPPRNRQPSLTAGTGRGVGMVEALADHWGATPEGQLHGFAKGVYFTLPT